MRNKIEKIARLLFVSIFALSILSLPVKYYAASVEANASTSAIVSKAYSKIGAKYVYGASHSYSAIKNPNQSTFDCSGFVSWVYYQSGHSIGVRTTSSLASVGKRVAYKDLQPGDILLFPHHTGIYIGNNKMIHAPNSGSRVRVQSLSGYYQKRFKQARRVVNSNTSSSVVTTAISKVSSSNASTTKTTSTGYTTGYYKLNSTMTVRRGPSTSYRRAGSLRKGTKVYVYSVHNGRWAKIKYRGTYRYVSLRYATKA